LKIQVPAIRCAVNFAAGTFGAVAVAVLSGCSGNASSPAEHLLALNSGGATTVNSTDRHAFSRPAANLDVSKRATFSIGNAFFNSPWIVAPASAGARDGLGPLFNARSCDACHNNDGRGEPPAHGDRPISLVIQFATPTPGANNEPGADPAYGVNLNPFSVGEIPAEGTVLIHEREVHGQFADGEPYTLLAPDYEFGELAYGPITEGTGFSPRVAPSVFGVGLLEAIPETQILERADPDDRDGDGISGKPNRVWNHRTKQMTVGRFGWKSNQPDIAHQTAAAFSSEIGMSTSLRPGQICTPAQTQCLAAPHGGEPEISDEIFGNIVRYQRTLGVPARRNLEDPLVKKGAQLFSSAGCAACHRSTFVTAEISEEPAISKQTIHPFTDLLLHDMGPALADNRVDFDAAPNEWRTPPLWGLGLQEAVNGHTRLLHDGRARNITEAILWHGGEAEASKEAFRSMTQEERKSLLKFLESL
jgi:CxxC motif-containing protein (DUF1111 family)